jgi:tetratricopeptide (TPR) repeat protein
MVSSPRIDELKKKFDENPRRYFAPLANEYRKSGDLEQAIQLCRAYLPQQPGHMSGHIVFGQALFEAGKLDEARSVFETALGLDPENLIALRHLGDIARAHGDMPGARAWYQRVLDADPRNEEIAAQIATIDAAPPVAPPAAAPTAGDQKDVAGWGDINPETAKAASPAAAGKVGTAAAAGAPPAAGAGAPAQKPTPLSAVKPELVDRASLELRDSLSMPVVKPSLPPAAAAPPQATAPPSSAMTEPEFERDGEGAFAPPNPDAATRPSIGVERSEEVDFHPSATADTPDAMFGAGAEPVPIAPPSMEAPSIAPPPPAPQSIPSPSKAPAETRDNQSFGSSNEFGFEVMEFVPPPRESDPTPVHDQSGRGGFGVPFTGETNARDETPAAFVTETMAELYLQQGFTQEALTVYRQLLVQNPRDDGLRERIAALEKGSRSSVGAGAVSDKVYDEVQRRHTREPETIRAFFSALMRRRVLQRYDDSARAGHTRPESRAPESASSAWVAETPGRVEQSREGYGTFTATESEPASSGTAFIVPDGAAPPPGMAPGDEQRAEYRDDIAASPQSERGRAPVRLELPPAVEEHASPPPAYVAPPTDYPPPAAAYETPAPVDVESGKDYAAPAPYAPTESAVTQVAPDETGNITNLFAGEGVDSFDEQAARVLSGAFPVVEGRSLAGRPAEKAKNELSLDNVFREADRKTGRNSGGFSFDQFFSDGSGGAKPRSTDPSGTAVGGPDIPQDDDVAQFNDWLTGLKKK